MINSISSMSSSSMQRQPPPPEQDAFKVADSDGDGLVAGSELESVVAGISETTGNTISTDDALGFDSDGDGALSGEELFNLLSENRFGPPTGMDGESAPPPPPPPSMDQALSSYSQNSGGDLIQQLIDNLLGSSDETSTV